MRNLYDVFRAIRADETDHVSTMKACLDENVVLLSPSLEKKVLIGAGIVAATAVLFASGDMSGSSDLLSFNPADLALDGSSSFEIDALLAGAGTVVTQLFGSGSEAGLDAQEVAALEEGGFVAQFLSEGFVAGLLAAKVWPGKKDSNATVATALIKSDETEGPHEDS